MRPAFLKAAATALTMGATVASALFVTSHLKNPTAPLQPPVVVSTSGLSGAIVVGPAVQPTSAPPVASTYAS